MMKALTFCLLIRTANIPTLSLLLEVDRGSWQQRPNNLSNRQLADYGVQQSPSVYMFAMFGVWLHYLLTVQTATQREYSIPTFIMNWYF